MAKGRVICTCATCGKTFEMTADKYNRKEADEWEKWAAQAYTECTECYKKRKCEEEAAEPFTIKVMLDVATPAFVLVARGNTMPHKDELKEAGYHWGAHPTAGFLDSIFAGVRSSAPRKVWSKSIKLRQSDESLEKQLVAANAEIQALGAEVEIEFTDVDEIACRKRLQLLDEQEQLQAAIKQKQDEAIAALDKPQKPACYPTGYWNGRIYGKAKYGYRIYVDNNEVKLTNEEAQALEEWQKKKAEYDAAVKDIKDKIQ